MAPVHFVSQSHYVHADISPMRSGYLRIFGILKTDPLPQKDRARKMRYFIAIAYHSEAIVIAAWCELRKVVRHFRPDRVPAYRKRSADLAGMLDH